jgi:CxxC motif-containing protein
MKKISVLALTIVIAMVSVSFAAENESWMQKMKGKFQKKEIAIDNKTAPVKEINKNVPVKESKKMEAPKKERKDMTKSELAAEISKNLDREESILNLIPGLEKKVDPNGKEYYAYQGKKLDDLDKDTLDKILGRVRNEALRIRTDKLNRQLETVRRANAMAATASRVPRVPVPPTINVPPQVPRSVQPPSKPPAPPAPPRR